MKTIIIRAEDRKLKGQGHRTRAEAIYQACQIAGFSPHILVSNKFWLCELNNKNFKTINIRNISGGNYEADEIVKLTLEIRPEYLFLDGARFKRCLLEKLKRQGIRIILIDDNYKANQLTSWAVLNPNIYAKKELYETQKFRKILAGSDYILLREDFKATCIQKRKNGIVLMALGVSGKEELLRSVKSQIMKLGLKVVIADKFNAAQMVNAIDSASIVICGASVTLHEVLARGRYAIPVYQSYDQRLFMEWCLQNSIAIATTLNSTIDSSVKCIIKLVKEYLKSKSEQHLEISSNGANNAVRDLFSETE